MFGFVFQGPQLSAQVFRFRYPRFGVCVYCVPGFPAASLSILVYALRLGAWACAPGFPVVGLGDPARALKVGYLGLCSRISGRRPGYLNHRRCLCLGSWVCDPGFVSLGVTSGTLGLEFRDFRSSV